MCGDPLKRPFDLEQVLALVRQAVAPYPPAALFALAEAGHRSLFEQLVACLISVRTRDEVTLQVAPRLFARARTPAELLALPLTELQAILRPAAFAETKARHLQVIARRAVDDYGGALPCQEEALLALPGIGPKCAHLGLGIACGLPFIAVDIHVHRVTNRWGYVRTRSPEETMRALEQQLPRAYWVEINRLLVPFGKHICTGTLPRCTSCPVLPYCQQVGVRQHRSPNETGGAPAG